MRCGWCRWSARGCRKAQICGRRQHSIRHMQAETAIAFELAFIEELIGRRLLRKVGVERGISEDVGRLVAGDAERGFDHHQTTRRVIGAVVDAADGEARYANGYIAHTA